MPPITIRNETSQTEITLELSDLQIERAEQDSEYLDRLVDEYYTRQAEQQRFTPAPYPARVHRAPALLNAEQIQNQNSQEIEESIQGNLTSGTSQSLFIWNEAGILLLLSLYEENKEDMAYKRHKDVYKNISKKINEIHPTYKVTGGQCQSKINSLKKMYKKIKDHNNKSGNDRVTWRYYEKMEEIFGRTGWAQPVAVASEEGPFENGASASNSSPNEPQPRKRKLDSILEQFIAERKEYRNAKLLKKQENFEKNYKLKEQQHIEKMSFLRNLLNNNNM